MRQKVTLSSTATRVSLLQEFRISLSREIRVLRRGGRAVLQVYTRFSTPWQGRRRLIRNPACAASTHLTYRARQRHRRSHKRSKVFLAVLVLAVAAGIAGLSAAGYVLSVAASAPALETLKPIDQGTSSAVYAADGTRLGFIQSDEIRTPIPLQRIPESMQAATIAIEDERFYAHGGVDYEGVVRAAFKNLEAGKAVEGGSTITMQLVRNLYVGRERTLERKIREARLAEELEDRHSKRWILESYLNSVPYGTVDGQTAVGVQAAAETFFDKPAKNLTLEESALLAGLPQSPSKLNPFQNPRDALERRNKVLDKLEELGYISPARAATAKRSRSEERRVGKECRSGGSPAD